MILNVHISTSSQHQSHASGSSPGCPVSPIDSGYSSNPTTPPTSTQPEKNGVHLLADPWTHLEGSPSDSDDPFRGIDNTNTARDGAIRRHYGSPWRQTRQVTHSLRTTRPRPILPASIYYPGSGSTLRQQDANKGTSRPAVGFLRRPDRFIPARPRQATELSEKFRTCKAPDELTESERLLRHNGAAQDPFSYRGRTAVPLMHEFRSYPRPRAIGSRNRGSPIRIKGLLKPGWMLT